MTEGARRQCRLALTRKNTETHDELQLALFSSNHWSEESRQVRCGGSKNKPYCDGAHAQNGFSGAKDPNRVPDKRDNYEGAGVTLHDNRGICAHSARCTDNLKTVFKLGEEPWIDPNGDTVENIVATVQKCPSGALSYSIDGVEHRDRESKPHDNGRTQRSVCYLRWCRPTGRAMG